MRGAALLFGLLLVALLEGALRLGGLGGLPPLTVQGVYRVEDGKRIEARRVSVRYLARFFSRRDSRGRVRAGSMWQEVFLMPKEAGTLRVMMLGESTIEGFPHPRNLASASFLAEYLRQMAPGRPLEVLNLGATAVASYPIRCVAIEAMRTMQPDVIVVYGAHNEFFGAGGVASREPLGGSVAAMRLRHGLRGLALYQGLERILPQGGGESSDGNVPLITWMAQEVVTAPEDPKRVRAQEHLATNWRAIIDEARKRGIGVVLCTVASNTRDMAPMASWEGEGGALDSAELLRLADAATNATTELQARLTALPSEHPGHAVAHYVAARAQLAAGNEAEAARLFRKARDLDGLPWRGTTALNAAIREVAAREGVVLADVEAAFDAAAGGAPGWQFFDDHVHPSLRGQALLAETVARAMARNKMSGFGPEGEQRLGDWQAVAERLGANPLELYRVIYMMAHLYAQPPLQLNNERTAPMFASRNTEMFESADEDGKRLINNWSAANREVGQSLPISYWGLATMLRADRLDETRLYRTGAVLNQAPFTGEELAARLLNLLSVGLVRDVDRTQFDAMREELATLYGLVAHFPDEPSILTAYVGGALSLLEGDEAGFSQAMKAVAENIDRAPAEDRVYLRELPEVAAWTNITMRLSAVLSSPGQAGGNSPP
jgi:lysophospholipase L1-like esterase